MENAEAEVELIRGGGGIFDITVDGALVFSKKSAGTFPSDAEVKAIVSG